MHHSELRLRYLRLSNGSLASVNDEQMGRVPRVEPPTTELSRGAPKTLRSERPFNAAFCVVQRAIEQHLDCNAS